MQFIEIANKANGFVKVGPLTGWAAERLCDDGWSCIGIISDITPDDNRATEIDSYGVYEMALDIATQMVVEKNHELQEEIIGLKHDLRSTQEELEDTKRRLATCEATHDDDEMVE